MPKRRKVGNLLALAVLSALVQRPMHPYEMATALRAWGKDQDMEIKWGSLYTVVAQPGQARPDRAVESVREGRRPERTVYRITDAGRAELVDWARELVSDPDAGASPLPGRPVGARRSLRPTRRSTLLRQRLDAARGRDRQDRGALDARPRGRCRGCSWSSRSTTWPCCDAEAAWMRGAARGARPRARYPGLDAWRAFHETGEMPRPRWPKLAEKSTEDSDRTTEERPRRRCCNTPPGP